MTCPKCGAVMVRHHIKPRYFCPNEGCDYIEKRMGTNHQSHKFEVVQEKIGCKWEEVNLR